MNADEANTHLYGLLDALNTEQKTLLVMECLTRVHKGLEQMESPEGEGQATVVIMAALAQIAGYTVQSERERLNFKISEKSMTKVMDVIMALRDTVHASALEVMSPELRAKVEKVNARVQERVQAGEDLQEVFQDELARHGVTPDGNLATEPDDAAKVGFYL